MDVDRVEKIVVAETNEFRKEQRLTATAPETALRRTAEAFAAFMARTDKYGHEADGRSPGERAKSHGYDWCRVSENISYQWSSADFETAELAARLVEGWKKSPGHRRNMLDPSVTETAVAVARSPRSGKYYAVQMFGRPRGGRGC
ncbi:MAG TPA: CAP domain-containing protein [Usitatibacter sp.]|nr:CAP domain-containing protein [Usitatibacter sp.]